MPAVDPPFPFQLTVMARLNIAQSGHPRTANLFKLVMLLVIESRSARGKSRSGTHPEAGPDGLLPGCATGWRRSRRMRHGSDAVPIGRAALRAARGGLRALLSGWCELAAHAPSARAVSMLV